jgi:hypothetical protein
MDTVELSTFVRDRAIPNVIDFRCKTRSSAMRRLGGSRIASGG